MFLTLSRGRKALGKREKHKIVAETCLLVRLHWPPPNPALEIALPTAKCLEIRVSESVSQSVSQ